MENGNLFNHKKNKIMHFAQKWKSNEMYIKLNNRIPETQIALIFEL